MTNLILVKDNKMLHLELHPDKKFSIGGFVYGRITEYGVEWYYPENREHAFAAFGEPIKK